MLQHYYQLTGIGSEKTRVKIVADPVILTKSTHHIIAAGAFGKMTFTIENFKTDSNNPKTSSGAIATLSAIETLRKYCSNGIQIGT